MGWRVEAAVDDEGGGRSRDRERIGDRRVMIEVDETPYSWRALRLGHSLCISWQRFLRILGRDFFKFSLIANRTISIPSIST